MLLLRSLCEIRISQITTPKWYEISLFLHFLILYQQNSIFNNLRLTMTYVELIRGWNYSRSLPSALNTQLWSLLSIRIIHKKLIACAIEATSSYLTRSRTLRLSKLRLFIRRRCYINPMIKAFHCLTIIINLRRANFTLPRCWKLSSITWYLQLLFDILSKLLDLILHLLLISIWELKRLLFLLIR